MPYPWYEIVAGRDLQQGDLLAHCLAPVPPRVSAPDPALVPGEQAAAAALPQLPERGDIFDRVIVLSQSCDLEDGDIARVMVCPVHALQEFLDNAGETRQARDSLKGNLKRGRLVAYHLLNTCDLVGFNGPHLVADFGDAFSVPLAYAQDLAEHGARRLRLLPPYREQLAQNFARFYMRVGLPIDMTAFP